LLRRSLGGGVGGRLWGSGSLVFSDLVSWVLVVVAHGVVRGV